MKKVLYHGLGITAYTLIMLGIMIVVAMLGGLSSPDFSMVYWRNYLGGFIVSVTLLGAGGLILAKLLPKLLKKYV